jgi:hypothetical protein
MLIYMSNTEAQGPCDLKLATAFDNAFEHAVENLKMDNEAADAYAIANEMEWALANEDPCSCTGCLIARGEYV